MFSGGGFGIIAISGTAGGVTVSGSGAVTSTASNAIVAQILDPANNGAVLVERSGPITGAAGIAALTPGGGAVTVNVSNDVTATGTAATAIDVGGAGGLASVNVAGGTILATGAGISAISTGNGGVRVNMTGGQVGTAAQRTGGIGISTFTQGTAGDINITANSVFSTGDGIAAQFVNPASNGSANVGINGGATVNSSAGVGVNLQGGINNAIANLGTVSGTTAVQTASGRTTIINTGSMIGTGGTAVQLAGANNLFVMDGPTSALTGQAIGSGTDTFRLGGGGSNTFNAGQIGAGWTLLDKAGSSTWTLTGTASYGGPTTVSAGTLLVNGSLASSNGVTVASGATLGGIGTVASTTVNSGGNLSPGNSIGTITISGNLTFVGAGNYIVEAAPAAADRTNVTGSASLSGTLQAIATGGSYTLGTRYVVLNATGGVSGAFGNLAVSGSFGATRPRVEYDPNNIYLVLDTLELATRLPPNAASRNRRGVAAAVDAAVAAGNNSPLFTALFNLSGTQLPAALDAVSGEVHASAAGALMDESSYLRNAVLGRLRQASHGDDSRMASLAAGGPQTAFADGEEFNALAYGKSPLPAKAPPAAPVPTRDMVFWAQGFGAWGKFDSDGNAAALRRDLAGVFSGFDMRFGNWRGGIAAGYTGSRNNTDRGSATVDSGHLALYGSTAIGAFNLRAGAGYTGHSIDTDRTIAFPGFFDRATAHYQGATTQVFGEAGYGLAFGNVAVEPFAGAAWVHLDTDATSERGGAAALNVARTTFEVGYSTLGVRAASLIPLAHDMVLVPRATLAWQHAFNDVTPNALLAFQGPGVPFTVSGVPLARDSLLAEAGLDLAIGRNATLGLSYAGQVARNVVDHAAKGKFAWKF